MNTHLYLDTARMGAMCPPARDACQAYIALTASEGCSTCFESLLRDGFDAWPSSLREQYTGLSAWPGLTQFKNHVRAATTFPDMQDVLTANRTSNLMRLAARCLFRICERVLTTDLEWPGYLTILEHERLRAKGIIIQVPLRAMLLPDRCSPQDLVQFVIREYVMNGCDGLFLSAVTYQGIKLPVHDIVQAVGNAPRPPLIVIDGAQTFGHAPVNSLLERCDFFIAGAHKWLQAAFPMGLGLCPRLRSQQFIQHVLDDMIATGELDDPLLQFSRQSEAGKTEPFGETVSLVPLFPCAGAIAGLLQEDGGSVGRFHRLLDRARQLESAAEGTSWQPLVPRDDFRSGMLLLQGMSVETRSLSPATIRQRFQDHGVVLSSYAEGTIRLSAPTGTLRSEDLARLHSALHACV